MAIVFADKVKVRSYSTGTAEFTLETTVPGFQSFAAIGAGNECYYGIEDAAGNWEVGRGTYDTDSTQELLFRDTVISSSNSNTLVNFPPGGKSVYVTIPSSVASSILASAASDSFKTIAVTGQSSIVADSLTDTLTLAAGNGIDITIDATSDTVTIGADLSAINQNIIPDTDVTYDLGSSTNRFRDLYLSGSTIKLGDAVISSTLGGGITVPGGVTSTVTTPGIVYIQEFLDTGGVDISWFFDDSPGNNFTPTVVIPNGWGTADVVQVYLAYSRITTNEELFNRQLTPSEYTISGNLLTINVVVPNVNVRGSFQINAYNEYFVNDTWTAPVGTIGPFTDGAEIAANGYDLNNPAIAKPVWDIQLDGSNFLSSLTLLDGGKEYLSYGSSTDNLRISASYAPSTVINFDSPAVNADFYNPRSIASTSNNPGQFATPGPFTASWTDGTRSVSIDYEVVTYLSNGLVLEYLRLVSDSSYSITGTFTGSDLVSDGVYLQRPELNFVIDPSNPTVLLPVVDWGTLTNFTVILIRFPVTGHVSGILPLGGLIGEITVSATSGVSSKAIAPAHSYGEFGDKAGMIAWDGTYLYYCTADYVDDLTDIWIRVLATDTSW